MSLKIVDFDLDCLEFPDRYGVMRTTYGCSLKGREEFTQRLVKLKEIMAAADKQETVASLYSKDKIFTYCCDRALELNGIDPDWVNGKILTGLLFLYDNEPGLLVQLNTPVPQQQVSSEGGGEATYTDLLSALWSHTEDLKQAIELAETRPWKEVLGAIEARVKAQKEAQKQQPSEKPTPRTYQASGETPDGLSSPPQTTKFNKPTQQQMEKSRIEFLQIQNRLRNKT